MAMSGAPVWAKNGAKIDLGLTCNPRRVEKKQQQNLTSEQTNKTLVKSTNKSRKNARKINWKRNLELVETGNNCNRSCVSEKVAAKSTRN